VFHDERRSMDDCQGRQETIKEHLEAEV
jgi:hypothetical protein